MNKKKIFATTLALGCAFSIFSAQPTEAAGVFGIVIHNIQIQEANAHHWAKKEFNGEPHEGTSEKAIKYGPIVRSLQKRLCDANGMEIVEEKLQHTYDFKTKVHPIMMIDGYNNAMSMGAGYVYVGTDYLDNHLYSKYKNCYDYMYTEHTIAHELTHARKGHSVTSLLASLGNQFEKTAELGSIDMMEPLPEGGWGSYLVSMNHKLNRPKKNWQVMHSFEKKCDNKIRVEEPTKVIYKAKDGKDYSMANEVQNDISAYFGGQMAYCLSKGALKLDNIQLMDNHLKDDIHFEGSMLLVCKDSSLPNGYRVLYGVTGLTREQAERELRASKKVVTNGEKPLSSYDYMIKRVQSQSIYIWLACAVAHDAESR